LMENIFWTIEILDTRLGISWNYKWMGNTGVCFVFQLNKLPKISVGANCYCHLYCCTRYWPRS
ncbi:MAG: hypothetical protein AB8G05_18015, partial [Oligoflexales bacterium]